MKQLFSSEKSITKILTSKPKETGEGMWFDLFGKQTNENAMIEDIVGLERNPNQIKPANKYKYMQNVCKYSRYLLTILCRKMM